LANWRIVDVLESDGETIHQATVAAVGRENLLREMRMLYPPTIDSPQPAARAQLVRRMNGTIWVESQEREGSRFTFELPVA